MLLIGHRGHPAKFLENTLASFESALVNGLDGIELDIRLSSDKALMVFHDNTLDRLSEVEGRVITRSSLQLKGVTLERDNKIPELEEVLALVKKINPKALVHLDVKDSESIPYLAEKLKLYKDFNILFSSFNLADLILFKKLNGHFPICLSIDDELSATEIIATIERSKKIGLDWVSIEQSQLNHSLVNDIKGMDLKIATWSIVNDYQFLQAYQYHIDAIIMDDVNLKFSSFFAIFSLPEYYIISEEELEHNFLAMQRVFHPDRNINSKRLIEDFARKSSLVNEAFNTLRDDLKRANYLLHLYNINLDLENTTANADILMQQMEKREKLSKITSVDQLIVIQRLSHLDIKMIASDLEKALHEKDYEKAKNLAISLKYAQKFLEEVKIKRMNFLS